MENFKEKLEDLKYLASEIQSTIDRNRFDIPEDLHKILLDLNYHTKNTLKEMEKEYEQFIETWNNSDCELR